MTRLNDEFSKNWSTNYSPYDNVYKMHFLYRKWYNFVQEHTITLILSISVTQAKRRPNQINMPSIKKKKFKLNPRHFFFIVNSVIKTCHEHP